MKKLALFAISTLMLASLSAQAQNVRVRGTITSLDGDVLSVKSRDGKDMKLTLTPDATVGTAKAMKLSDIKEGTLVGVTSVKGGDGKMVAKEVHIIPPTAPQGHMNWDLLPNSMMTNGSLASPAKASGGNEITVKYKDGEQKILVTSETAIVGFENGSRADLKPGETIFSVARVEGDGKLVAPRLSVSKSGVKPPQ
jgi:hypothetical protein